MKKFFTVFIISSFMLLPVMATALSPSFPCPPGLKCDMVGQDGVTIVNSVVLTLVNWLLSIAFSLAVLFVIIGGLRFIVSAGNQESGEKAKATVINALIGIILIILSYTIINMVAATLLTDGGSPTP